ncbi:MAG: hypothetical protein COT14_02020 [Candidatus Diapherotrites archaeon CG08_land_8_20_14_0_20_30_16]|nr:MAG: hypothetical protein COT14_02020 [Candidatus Diapherotrites archaeon CG08_land_8_20_14_0_20_30_16]
MWWIYAIIAFVYVWIFSAAMFRAKRNYLLFYITAFLPFFILAGLLVIGFLLVFFPLIYIILFIYSFFTPAMKMNYIFKKIKLGKQE